MNLFDEWSSTKNFADKEVGEEKLEKVFRDTTKAPTAFNLQPYSFKVAESEQAFQGIEDALIPENQWVLDADKIVVLIGDGRMDSNLEKALDDMLERGLVDEAEAEEYRKRITGYSGRSEGFRRRWLTRNTMIPATFFMLACVDKGLGCCPVKGFDEEKLREGLGLEGWERPHLIIPVGYPEDESERTWRRDAEEIYEFI